MTTTSVCDARGQIKCFSLLKLWRSKPVANFSFSFDWSLCMVILIWEQNLEGQCLNVQLLKWAPMRKCQLDRFKTSHYSQDAQRRVIICVLEKCTQYMQLSKTVCMNVPSERDEQKSTTLMQSISNLFKRTVSERRAINHLVRLWCGIIRFIWFCFYPDAFISLEISKISCVVVFVYCAETMLLQLHLLKCWNIQKITTRKNIKTEGLTSL